MKHILLVLVLVLLLDLLGWAQAVTTFQGRGVNLFTYPLTVQLLRPLSLTGAFQFGITAPPGVYTVLGSSNLAQWSELALATNSPLNLIDTIGHELAQRFYRASAIINLKFQFLIMPFSTRFEGRAEVERKCHLSRGTPEGFLSPKLCRCRVWQLI
jgi:hypothetical protein